MSENRAEDSVGGRKAAKGLVIVACVTMIWMAAVFGRLSYLQLFRHSEYLARAQRQQQRTIEITPKRGAIYDRNMHPLAMSIPVDSVFAVPSEIKDEALAARLLSGVLGIPRDVLETRLGSSRSFVWIARKLPPDKKEAVEALNLKGIEFLKENQRFYPKRDLAAHVLGFVDLDEKVLAALSTNWTARSAARAKKL
jgi:cell division protein FtsI (penicillin-binding protein 3)